MISATQEYSKLKSAALGCGLGAAQGVVHRTTISNRGGDIQLFVDESGAQGVWVPFGAKDEDLTPDTRSRSITLKSVLQGGYEVAELRLLEPSLEAVFHSFVDAFLRNLAVDSETAVTRLAVQLKRWRSLFVPTRSGKLGLEAELGLIGELQTLRELMATDGDLAFYRWTGPDASRHDFKFDDREIECKATTAGSGLNVKINGLHQLENSTERPLILVVRKYERTPNGSLSLREIVSELLMNDVIPPDEFIAKLREIGYDGLNFQASEEERYEPSGTFVFDVNEGFPRLQLRTVPDRLIHCSYTLDLNPPEEIPGFRPDGSMK